jgi:uncharacterized OB-fold protein
MQADNSYIVLTIIQELEMLIFGTGVQKKTVGRGEFHCPRCSTKSKYERKKIKNLVTLASLPVMTTDADEFIQCSSCNTTYQLSILQYKPKPAPPTLAQLLTDLQERLQSGTAVEYLVRDLTSAGHNRTAALQSVNATIGTQRHACKSCGLTYASTIETCSECHKELETA